MHKSSDWFYAILRLKIAFRCIKAERLLKNDFVGWISLLLRNNPDAPKGYSLVIK